MIRAALFAIAVLLGAAAPAAAQDPTVVDPDHYRVEFENDQIRVLHITYGPNEKSVMHQHPDAYYVALTDLQMRMHMPDDETADIAIVKGENLWTPAVEHVPENLTDQPIEGILIELKGVAEDD